MRKTRLKVCCIASIDEAKTAISLGADALGLVSEMPSGPGPIPDEKIAEIADSVPTGIATFLLTCRTEGNEIVDQLRFCKTNTVQLVDEVQPQAYQTIRRALPEIRIVQVLHVAGEEKVEEAARIAPMVDALLLDSGNPDLPVKELGGTGRVHNWEISRRIVQTVATPVFLAGGIRPENVSKAIRAVGPYGIDLCTGVRTDDRLDPDKLAALTRAMASAQDRRIG